MRTSTAGGKVEAKLTLRLIFAFCAWLLRHCREYSEMLEHSELVSETSPDGQSPCANEISNAHTLRAKTIAKRGSGESKRNL